MLLRRNAEKQQTLDTVMLHETQRCNGETLPHFAERNTATADLTTEQPSKNENRNLR